MKIGIIHGFVGGGGGTEKTLLSLIEALTEQKHIVNLYTVSKPTIQISGVKIYSILPFSLPFFGLYQRYMESRLIGKAKDDDLVIQTSGGLVVPENNNQKILIYCHHYFQNETEKTVTKYKGVWSWYYKPYYASSLKFINQIKNENIYLIANSKFIQESLKRKFGKNSTVIYPPVELNSFRDGNQKEKKVVTVSRYSQEKNLEFAIDVFDDFKTDYIIIGNTKTRINEVYYENLHKKIKNQKSKSRIQLLKNIDRNKVINNLRRAKVYFHASPETFGISIIESIAAGCIPIVPDNSAHKETVPFSELRYDQTNVEEARAKVKMALDGNYDEFVNPLQASLRNYGKETFKKTITEYIAQLKV